MSYSIYDLSQSQAPASPLTTIFTPPSDCETRPQTWSYCIEGICYWDQPESCYPPGARSKTSEIQLFQYTETLQYSIGVLPSGYTTINVITASDKDETAAVGCYSGFTSASDPFYMCSSAATSSTYILNAVAQVGDFDAYLPRIVVAWAASELSSFTPASAPVLGNAASAQPPSSPAKTPASASATPTSQGSSTGTSAGASNASKAAGTTASSQQVRSTGLSTGAKAGIGVGVAVVALALIALATWFCLRRRKRSSGHKTQRAGHSSNERPYVDSKAELPGTSRWNKIGSRSERNHPPEKGAAELQGSSVAATKPEERDAHELSAQREQREMALVREAYEIPATREPQEIGTNAASRELEAPPPVPLASKPRYHA